MEVSSYKGAFKRDKKKTLTNPAPMRTDIAKNTLFKDDLRGLFIISLFVLEPSQYTVYFLCFLTL